MNYSKIYQDFIIDRRSKEGALIESGQYKEKHHIIPRSLGGDNSKENLIFLSAEDHMRAHLLLAKIYGGTMWAAVLFTYHGNPDKRIPTKKMVRAAVYAKLKFWEYSKLPENVKKVSDKFSKKDIINLYHFSGDEWSGTRLDFKNHFGKKLYFQTPDGNCAGWYKSKEQAKSHFDRDRAFRASNSAKRGDISGKNNPMAGSDRRKRAEIKAIHKNGDKFFGCTTKLAEKLNLTVTQYGQMMKTLFGKKVVNGFVVKSYHGWALV